MTLFTDNGNNPTIVSPSDVSEVTSSRMHYLHPDYVDDKSKFIYSQNRCPLSMLAETCKNIGKACNENTITQSQDSSISISPSYSSSSSAPKFSPDSCDLSSSVDQTKLIENGMKEKTVKDKPKKRKFQKKDSGLVSKMSKVESQGFYSNYAISEFLKMNHIPQLSFLKSEIKQMANNINNHLTNQGTPNQFNHSSSVWKSNPNQVIPTSFPMNYLSQNYTPSTIPLTNGIYRCPPPNLLHDINQFYLHNPMEKSICDCLTCVNQKYLLDRNLLKNDPLFNILHDLHKERSANHPLLSFLQNHNSSLGNSVIKYCMYCGQCIPTIQNLLNHIYTEHIDILSSSLKLIPGMKLSRNFTVSNLHSKDVTANDLQMLKNMELLKHLQYLYNSDNQTSDNDKTILMK